MKKKIVILVSGHKRVGKDSISNMLEELLDSSILYSFATPVKNILATTLDISVPTLDLLKNEETPLCFDNGKSFTDFRAILKNFANEAMKKWFGDNVWVDVFLNKSFNEKFIIVTDWRFNIEHENIIKQYDNVVTIRVHSDKMLNTDNHSSETELNNFDFDYIIDNTAKDHTVTPQVIDIAQKLVLIYGRT